MATNVPLTWNPNNEGKQRRSARISTGIWKTHKPTIRKLYKNKSLANVMEIMKTDHDFEATHRQYTHILKKWKIYKKGTDKGQEDDVDLKSKAGLGSETCSESGPAIYDQIPKTLKRANSRQNNGNRKGQSIDSTPISKSLQMILGQDTGGIKSSFGESQSLVSSTSSNEVIVAKNDFSNASGSRPTGSPQPSHSTNCAASSAGVSEVVNSEIYNQVQPPVSTPQLDSYVTLPMERGSTPLERLPPTEQLNRSGLGSYAQSLGLETCLKISQDLKGFLHLSDDLDLPRQDMDLVKVAADHLFAVDQPQAAGHIYSFLLVAEESGTLRKTTQPGQGIRILTPRMVAAFRSARTVSQWKLVQDLLLSRLEVDQDQHCSVSELFLVHQFLADCYGRQGSGLKRLKHLRQSWAIALRLNQEGDPWLMVDHSVMFYLRYKSAFPELPSPKCLNVADLKDISSRPRRLEAYGATPIGYDDFMVFCLLVRNLVRGEEEARRRDDIPDHRILNCVRGCIAWCGSINENIQGEFSPFKRLQYIWDAWQGGATVLQNRPCLAMVPEIDLGISTSEHLHICAQIFFSIDGAKGLSAMSDHKLADLYLKFLFGRVSANVWRPTTSQDTGNNYSGANVAKSIMSSRRSSDASLKDFETVSQSMKQRVAELPSTEAGGSYNSGSLRQSHRSHMSHLRSHLSDMFERASIREEVSS